MIGAAFRHRTSRAGDPQLHTHVLVANATWCEDGVWRALDGRLLYAQARTAGFLYQAELRHALTQSLGVAWEYPMNGQAELAGFGREVLREFSRRRIEIEEAAAALGDDSVRSRRRLAVETRTAKDYNVDPEQLRTSWRERADLHGLSRGRVEELCRSQHPSQHSSVHQSELTALDAGDEWLAFVVNTDDSTFDRRAVLRLVANHSPQGATILQVEARADRFLASGHVEAVGVALTGVQYATVEHLALERHVLDTVEERRAGRLRRLRRPAIGPRAPSVVE